MSLVTGAAGQVAYSRLYSNGNGKDQPIILGFGITPIMGVLMELQDCALPLLKDVITTDKEETAFKDLDVAILVGFMPRRDGMEWKDLLKANMKIFKCQGAALDKYAKKSVKAMVVGNPANTNCLTTSKLAPSIPKENFSCLTLLHHNPAEAQTALKLGVTSDDVKNVIIWGYHSSTNARVKLQGKEVGHDAAVIKAQKLSSATSAAKAICDHGDTSGLEPQRESLCPWALSLMATPMKVVEGLPINDFSREKMDLTAKEPAEVKETAFEFPASA
ncbi:hypothetical protein FD755_015633 [Muntiacus reevesi]|uniref:Malate dehydrogenase, cytoplasmic n=1 Tax=Muntiacus reevesi TaxID=9886 RepID=A0A5N3XFY5_MUNRE|nr:hypothetical protein FD755_015633 [Muntiacus reevesi]